MKYMYRTWLLILLIASIFLSCQNKKSQVIKPVFKELDYVIYHADTAHKQLKLFIDNYLKVDSTGLFHHLDLDNHGVDHDTVISDTTFRLPDSLIVQLNSIFNGIHKLSFYKAGSDFGYTYSEHNYLRYETKEGIKDEIIVFDGVSDTSLVHTLNKFWKLPHATIRQKQHTTYKNEGLIKEIWACQNRQHVYLDWNQH